MPGRGSDHPAFGIEYNGIIDRHGLSGSLWQADIARTPMLVKSVSLPGKGRYMIVMDVDVQGNAYKANGGRYLLDKEYNRLNKKGNMY